MVFQDSLIFVAQIYMENINGNQETFSFHASHLQH